MKFSKIHYLFLLEYLKLVFADPSVSPLFSTPLQWNCFRTILGSSFSNHFSFCPVHQIYYCNLRQREATKWPKLQQKKKAKEPQQKVECPAMTPFLGRVCIMAPSLTKKFKTVISHIVGETIFLSVFYYWICPYLCPCCSFNPYLCHLAPFHQ